MKAEIKEHEVVLIPETEFDKRALERLRFMSIQSKVFQDDWESKGGLRFIEAIDPWDQR